MAGLIDISWSQLHVRHVIPAYPPSDAIREIAAALPGSASWVAITGKPNSSDARGVSLRARAVTLIGAVRRRYREAIDSLPPADLVIYHSAWGTDLFSSIDGRTKRVFWQHDPAFGTRAALDRLARTVDVLWFDREPWRAAARASHRWIPEKRMRHLPLIFRGSDAAGSANVKVDPPSRLGWVGSLQVTPDRADRLLSLVFALEDAGFDGQIEICGDGRLEKKLRRTLPPDRATIFPFEDWKRRLTSWDGLLILDNDIRWTAPLVHALRGGIGVILPIDESGADLPPEATYPAGDMAALAAYWAPSHESRRIDATRAARILVEREAALADQASVHAALSSVQSLPVRVQRDRGINGSWPFAVYCRMHRLLSGRA